MALIMVIDDSEDMRRLMRSLLGFLEHTAVTFSLATDALEYLDQPGNDLPDLIISDYMMPEMDGLECLRHLRGSQCGRDIPVVLFTADDDPGLKARARGAGADTLWLKTQMDLPAIRTGIEKLVRKACLSESFLELACAI